MVRTALRILLIASTWSPVLAAPSTRIVTSDHLACVDRADAVRLVHWYVSDEFPSFRSFLAGMESSGRCVWWRKGDKVTVTGSDAGDGVTVSASRPGQSRPMYFDRCFLEGEQC